MNVIELAADTRTETSGSSASNLRKSNKVPGVLYGVEENLHFSVEALEARKLIYTPNFNLIDIDIDGKTHRCILKDYQAHPVTDEIVHIDLLALKEGRKLKVEVPVRFVGTAEGVKAGGTVVRKIRKVKIKTTPELLVDRFDVDITHLSLGQSVRVRDMEVAEGIEILNPEANPMATIEIPRALKAAEAADAKAAEGLEAEDDAEDDEAPAEE